MDSPEIVLATTVTVLMYTGLCADVFRRTLNDIKFSGIDPQSYEEHSKLCSKGSLLERICHWAYTPARYLAYEKSKSY